jgi:hypothetical protein
VRIAATLLCGAALLAAGCGGGERATPSANAIVRAVDRTIELGGHHVEMDMRIGATTDRTAEVELHAAGDVDLRTARAVVKRDVPSIEGTSPNPDTVVQTLIRRGPVSYVRYDTKLFRRAGVEARWLKDDISKPPSARARAFRRRLGIGGLDPSDYLHYLRAARGPVARIGEEPVGAVPTTHYRGTVRLDEIGAGQPAFYRRVLRAEPKVIMRETERGTLPVDVWIDKRGAVRRIQFQYESLSQVGRPGVVSNFTVTEHSGFGRDVDATPPPADQVISLEELVRLAE